MIPRRFAISSCRLGAISVSSCDCQDRVSPRSSLLTLDSGIGPSAGALSVIESSARVSRSSCERSAGKNRFLPRNCTLLAAHQDIPYLTRPRDRLVRFYMSLLFAPIAPLVPYRLPWVASIHPSRSIRGVGRGAWGVMNGRAKRWNKNSYQFAR